MPEKPSKLPRWATDPDTTIEPNEGKKDVGFVRSERPPARYFNWLFNLFYQWTAYLNDPVGTGGEPGLKGTGSSAGSPGLRGTGTEKSAGVQGFGGEGDSTIGGDGVYGEGGGDDDAVGFSSVGVRGKGKGGGEGVRGEGGELSGPGVRGVGDNAGGGIGVEGIGGALSGTGVKGTAGGNGVGVHGVGSNAGPGVKGDGNGVNSPGGEFTGDDIGPGLTAKGGHSGGYGAIVEAGLPSGTNIRAALRLVPQAEPDIAQLGDIYVSSGDSKLYFHNGSGWVPLT